MLGFTAINLFLINSNKTIKSEFAFNTSLQLLYCLSNFLHSFASCLTQCNVVELESLPFSHGPHPEELELELDDEDDIVDVEQEVLLE
jgi:hypothetical protein